MEWYYTKEGLQNGPVSEAELKNLISDGTLNSADMVWNSTMSEWLVISDIPELHTAELVETPYQAPGIEEVNAPHAGSAANIPTYLWQSICVTLFCCMIGGVVAIVYAAKVDGLKQAGKLTEAAQKSQKAKKWCLWSLIVGLVFQGAYIAFAVIGAMSQAGTGVGQ